MTKIQKTAGALDGFFKLTYRLTIAANVLISIPLALSLLLLIGSPKLLEAVSAGLVQTLRFGGASFTLAPELAAPAAEAGTLYLIAGLAIGVAELALYVLMIRCIRRVLAPMKEGLPFAKEVAENFKTLAWLTIARGILDMAMVLVLGSTILRAYDLGEIFLSDKITAVNVNQTLDFGFVLLALIFYGLSYIFRYGQELQQLSDETL